MISTSLIYHRYTLMEDIISDVLKARKHKDLQVPILNKEQLDQKL